MRIMESDGDVMLGTCRGPNSEEALSIAMMLLRGMTNCYTSVKLGGQTDVLLSVESGQFLARALFEHSIPLILLVFAMDYLEIKASICWKEQSTAGRSGRAPRYGLTQESAEKYRREDKIRTLMRMRIMESDGDVMLKTCRGPNSEEALSIPLMLLRGMTFRYTFVKLGLFSTL